ncbi:MAG TPA: prenyltransferase [Syntrophomonadaceae bacterium]|nr:prenyltransferase [Syntrophomonadaceae bacterium]
MIELSANTIPLRLKTILNLIRIIPVLCWGISSSLVGLGFAYTSHTKIVWLDYVLVVLLIILIHGLISHVYNDREDWLSGTDPLSPKLLSGGSKVIARKYCSLRELTRIGRYTFLPVFVVTLYFFCTRGPSALFFLAIAIWSALAYSCSPFRLSYYPLTGEWLCAFPAVLACTTGTFYALTGTVQEAVIIGGVIHALLAIGLLMHHHISDIDNDLQALPRKITTVAWVSLTLGIGTTPVVELIYFFLALLMGTVGGLLFHPVLWITVPFSLVCMGVAFLTDPLEIMNITNKEYLLYVLIIGDAVTKTAILFYQ